MACGFHAAGFCLCQPSCPRRLIPIKNHNSDCGACQDSGRSLRINFRNVINLLHTEMAILEFVVLGSSQGVPCNNQLFLLFYYWIRRDVSILGPRALVLCILVRSASFGLTASVEPSAPSVNYPRSARLCSMATIFPLTPTPSGFHPSIKRWIIDRPKPHNRLFL